MVDHVLLSISRTLRQLTRIWGILVKSHTLFQVQEWVHCKKMPLTSWYPITPYHFPTPPSFPGLLLALLAS